MDRLKSPAARAALGGTWDQGDGDVWGYPGDSYDSA